ncbi:MAG: DUF1080 domain-containing protein [Chthonomonadales bacterium]|nr:DUF1080 domain-containing protein [Chthonomonadales bacterium]
MQRTMVLVALAAAVCGTCLAAPTDTPPVTPQEAAEGWIALFDGTTAYGWTPRGDARWGVAGDQIQVSDGGVGALATTTHFANFVLTFECLTDDSVSAGVAVRAPANGPVMDTNSYLVRIGDKHERWPTGSISGQVASRNRRPIAGRWTRFEIECAGSQVSVRIDGRQVARLNNKALVRGPVALWYGGTGSAKFRRILLKPLGTVPLFNGKDLTGWKAVEGAQATVSVTREGWLSVRNGRGDLQTTGAYGDFMLQMEIKTNGTHLNSGIFFRANAGGFWSGYEAQIRNQWNGDNRADPIDFGTGGIYNRQPARRVVSNDGQWFTLTVIAHGRHMATWVDGIQVTDFLDTRPPDETNARRGSRTSAGVISIQGHDPTTDLLFRNIRISPYPELQSERQ